MYCILYNLIVGMIMTLYNYTFSFIYNKHSYGEKIAIYAFMFHLDEQTRIKQRLLM